VWQRVAIRQGKFYARHGREFARHVVPAVMKPARSLWNQFIGFLFCVLAVSFGSKTIQLALDYHRNPEAREVGPLLLVCITAFCTLMMLWFGIGSFLRARRIIRS
jgi:hypothetical protein